MRDGTAHRHGAGTGTLLCQQSDVTADQLSDSMSVRGTQCKIAARVGAEIERDGVVCRSPSLDLGVGKLIGDLLLRNNNNNNESDVISK